MLNSLFISLHPCSVNQFFTLDVYNGDGSPLNEDQLLVQLRKICEASPQSSEEPVGILTSQDRNVWGKAYLELIKGKLSAGPARQCATTYQRPKPTDVYSGVVSIWKVSVGGSVDPLCSELSTCQGEFFIDVQSGWRDPGP